MNDASALPVQGRTCIVSSPNDTWIPTDNRETDARTALTRGLAEYLEQLSMDVAGGRQVRFERVFQVWADPEDKAKFPAACVGSTGAGTYDASKFTPEPRAKDRLPLPDGRYLVSPCDFVQDLAVDVWANDPPERTACVAMVEDALSCPVSWMYGMRLLLPHYFNTVGRYELLSVEYIDEEVETIRRYRRAVFKVRSSIAMRRLVATPQARLRFNLEVTVAGE